MGGGGGWVRGPVLAPSFAFPSYTTEVLSNTKQTDQMAKVALVEQIQALAADELVPSVGLCLTRLLFCVFSLL